LLAPYASKFNLGQTGESEEPISAEVDVSDTKTLSIATLAKMAQDVCAGPSVWKKRWGHDENAMAELEGRPEYCLDLTFMHGLLGLGKFAVAISSASTLTDLSLHPGYELSEKRELVVEKKLRGVELGWALGAGIALVEKATLTCTA
jgi:guanosine-diphosphatase